MVIAKETFEVKRNLSCTSKNVIYFIRCLGCQEFYIGQTGDIFRNRLTVHRQQMFRPEYRILGMSKHIASCGSSLSKKFEAAPLYQMSPSKTKVDREAMERRIIELLKPALNAISV